MRVDCIGGGALGLLLAARLAMAGTCRVRLVTRTEEQARTVRESGIRLEEPGAPDGWTARVEAVSFGQFASFGSEQEDGYAVLLTVKQKDIGEELLSVIRSRLRDKGLLCCFQNGLGHLERLSEAVTPSRLLAAVTTEGARRLSSAAVLHAGSGLTWIGPMERVQEAQPKESIPEFVTLLVEAGFDARISNSINGEIWNKLIINLAINPVTALLGIPNGALLESQEAVSLMRQLYEEAVRLAESLGLQLRDDLWEVLQGVCRATAANRSSMLQDIDAGRRTELEWLTGSLLRTAQGRGVALPAHETLYRLVRIKEDQGLNAAFE